MIKSHKHTLPTVVPGLLLCVWCTQWSCWPSTTSKGFKFSAYLDEWGVVVVANSLKLLSTNTVNKLNAFGETHGKNTISTQSINSALHTPLGAQTLFRHFPLSWTMKRFVIRTRNSEDRMAYVMVCILKCNRVLHVKCNTTKYSVTHRGYQFQPACIAEGLTCK